MLSESENSNTTIDNTSNNNANSEFQARLIPEDFSDDFRKIVHDYKCPLCKGVYYNPYVDKCGHVFCRECIHKYLQTYHQCPFSKQEITSENLNKLVFMSDILEKQLVKCKNTNHGCEWIGRLSELEPHMNIECKRQIICCPNEGCCDKIFREENEKHVAICDYRIVSCEYCKISIAFIDIQKHYGICPNFIMDCLRKCGKQVERKEMENHIEEFCLNTVINCPFTGVGCGFVCSKRDLATHFAKSSAEHMLFMYAFMIRSQRSLNSAKENISNALNKFQEKVRLTASSASFQTNENTKSYFLSEQTNLLTELKESLVPLEQNEAKDNSDIFSLLKVGFIFNKKRQSESKGCCHGENDFSGFPGDNANSSSFAHHKGLGNSMQEKICFTENVQALMESDEKVANANSVYNKESVSKLIANPVAILGNIPGNSPSILDLNEIQINPADKNENENCSKSKLLGFKRRKISEEEKTKEAEKEGGAIEIKNETNINEVQASSFMDIVIN